MTATTLKAPISRIAMAYATLSLIGLLVLTRIETPLEHFGAHSMRGVLLGGDWRVALLFGVTVGAATALLSELITRKTEWGSNLVRLLSRVLGELHPADIVLLSLLSASGEELLFRGIALPYLGLITSSIVFGFAHLVPRRGIWLWAVWATGAGLLLGFLAQSTGGLLAPFVAHFVINLIGLVSIKRSRHRSGPAAR